MPLLLWFAWKIVLLQYRKQQLVDCHYKTQVVICLKNRTFAVSQTTGSDGVRGLLRCDLLEKSYFCSIANNIIHILTSANRVVICLKNRTFAVSQTTICKSRIISTRLWFAWKIVLLQYRKQLTHQGLFCDVSCDLLEKSYFCSIANNSRIKDYSVMWVVICLKNRTFAVSQTTTEWGLPSGVGLWFAWKIVLLQYRKQLKQSNWIILSSCDLLEKSYFCSIANNSYLSDKLNLELWFAWKIVLLQYRKQQ